MKGVIKSESPRAVRLGIFIARRENDLRRAVRPGIFIEREIKFSQRPVDIYNRHNMPALRAFSRIALPGFYKDAEPNGSKD